MESPNPPQPSAPTYVWVAILMGVMVLAVQVIMLFLLLDTRSSIDDLSDDVRDVELRLAGGVPADASRPAEATGTTAATPATAAPATTAPATTGPPATDVPDTTLASPLENLPSSPAPELTTDAEGLPPLVSNTSEDPAVGAQLGDLGAEEWAEGTELVIDLADGKARALVVFAHWCPSCQELLPQLADWQDSTGATLENMEIVTIASATEQEADMTLAEYLEDQDLPFPVLVDSSNELAARLGVDAFPFWVFVGPEGQVIGRLVGQLPPDQFVGLFEDLEEIGAGG